MQTVVEPTRSADEIRGISEWARELEEDAARYPDERGEILLEAAHQWECAGQVDRAFALLHEVLTLGGEDAEYARASLADLCFKQGADSEAWEHLRALEQTASTSWGPAGMVAEMLEERGADEAALRWFDRAVATVDLEALAESGTAPPLHVGMTLLSRQQCRARLGLPADKLDHAADIAEDKRQQLVARLDAWLGGASQAEGSEFQPPLASGPATVRMLVWQRAEQQLAAQRWPEVFPAGVLGNHAAVEEQLRELSADPTVATITLVLGSAEGFAAYLRENGGDPADEAVRLAYSDQASSQGRTIIWPPARNALCWCGLARKYKKCCGVPASAR